MSTTSSDIPIPAVRDRAEALLRALVGIEDACVLPAGEGALEVRVLPATGSAATQVLRNVASAVFAGFGVRLLPGHIRIASAADLADVRAARLAAAPALPAPLADLADPGLAADAADGASPDASPVAAALAGAGAERTGGPPAAALVVRLAPYGAANPVSSGGCAHATTNRAGANAAPAAVAVATNSYAGNGHAAHGRPGNGSAATGHATNGHATNGHATNGHATNGHATNGHATNGRAADAPVGSGGEEHGRRERCDATPSGLQPANLAAGPASASVGAPSHPAEYGLAVRSLRMAQHHDRIRCHVALAAGGSALAGAGEALADGPGAAIELAARVTTDALRGATHAAANVQFGGAARVTIAGRPHIVVALKLWRDGTIHPLAGAAPVRESDERAAAEATLGALRELF